MALSEFERNRLLTDALVYEGQQHWLHYRHIEQERNQFLGFFFTLLVAVVGFFVAISSRAPGWPALAMGLTAMAAVLGLISLLILASVRKFGAALHTYGRDIERVKESLSALVQDGDRRRFSTPVQRSTAQRVFDPQFAAEVIVGTFAVAAFGVQVFVAVDALVCDDFSAGQRIAACALAAGSVGSVAAAVHLWITSREHLRVRGVSGP